MQCSFAVLKSGTHSVESLTAAIRRLGGTDIHVTELPKKFRIACDTPPGTSQIGFTNKLRQLMTWQ